MPRIVIAECKQEVSTFNPSPSHYEDFRIVRGPAMVDLWPHDSRLAADAANL